MKTATDLRGCGPFAEAAPAEVRAALIEEDVPDFDEHWHRVMAQADGSFDLSAVNAMLDHWRRKAWLQQDKDAYKRSMVAAAEMLEGRKLPPEPFSATKVRLGL